MLHIYYREVERLQIELLEGQPRQSQMLVAAPEAFFRNVSLQEVREKEKGAWEKDMLVKASCMRKHDMREKEEQMHTIWFDTLDITKHMHVEIP